MVLANSRDLALAGCPIVDISQPFIISKLVFPLLDLFGVLRRIRVVISPK